MHTYLTLAFLGSVDLSGLLLVILIFAVPIFFISRVYYRKKFPADHSRATRRSIVMSLILSPILVILTLATIIAILVNSEN